MPRIRDDEDENENKIDNDKYNEKDIWSNEPNELLTCMYYILIVSQVFLPPATITKGELWSMKWIIKGNTTDNDNHEKQYKNDCT